ncbi:hypothetical protein ABPG75_013375 [Micractinium tetrahymenae]
MELGTPKREPGQADAADEQSGWRSLGTPVGELRLEWTLPTGQSFRWRQTGEAPLEYMGVVGRRAVRLRQLANDVQYQVIARAPQDLAAADAAALRDYFNLPTSLAQLAPGWCAACDRYAAVHALLPGARMLRQDPVECLFQFICSSNNHISRIAGMVERLCRDYGTPLVPAPLAAAGNGAAGAAGAVGAAAQAGEAAQQGQQGQQQPLELYAFPTLEQLAAATEEQLRAAGFGYRAKYITGSVAQLLAKPGGGAAWLQGLRSVPYEEASEALCTLPGIGPKVAACICLFSLDKHEAIPVDTHVWALACKYYTPHLRSKSLTKKIHGEVQAAFVDRFGPYAGWAHNTLFISELASTRDKVPAIGASSKGRGGAGGKRKAGAASSSGSEDEGDAAADSEEGSAGSSFSAELRGNAGAGTPLPHTPAEGDAAVGRRPRRRATKKAMAGTG